MNDQLISVHQHHIDASIKSTLLSIEISVSFENLPNLDLLGDSDPKCELFYGLKTYKNDLNKLKLIDETEKIDNVNHGTFAKKLVFYPPIPSNNTRNSINQLLFKIDDIDKYNKELIGICSIDELDILKLAADHDKHDDDDDKNTIRKQLYNFEHKHIHNSKKQESYIIIKAKYSSYGQYNHLNFATIYKSVVKGEGISLADIIDFKTITNTIINPSKLLNIGSNDANVLQDHILFGTLIYEENIPKLLESYGFYLDKDEQILILCQNGSILSQNYEKVIFITNKQLVELDIDNNFIQCVLLYDIVSVQHILDHNMVTGFIADTGLIADDHSYIKIITNNTMIYQFHAATELLQKYVTKVLQLILIDLEQRIQIIATNDEKYMTPLGHDSDLSKSNNKSIVYLIPYLSAQHNIVASIKTNPFDSNSSCFILDRLTNFNDKSQQWYISNNKDQIISALSSLTFKADNDDDDDNNKVNDNPKYITVETYENQRAYPFLGFTPKLLPTDPYYFSNQQGDQVLKKSSFQLKDGYYWLDDWHIVDKMDDFKLDHGWLYAVDFPNAMVDHQWYPSQSKLRWVRRRKWIRTMCKKNINQQQQQQALLNHQKDTLQLPNWMKQHKIPYKITYYPTSLFETAQDHHHHLTGSLISIDYQIDNITYCLTQYNSNLNTIDSCRRGKRIILTEKNQIKQSQLWYIVTPLEYMQQSLLIPLYHNINYINDIKQHQLLQLSSTNSYQLIITFKLSNLPLYFWKAKVNHQQYGLLGHICTRYNTPPKSVKVIDLRHSNPKLYIHPTSFKKIWSIDHQFTIYQAICDNSDYIALGYIVMLNNQIPNTQHYYCILKSSLYQLDHLDLYNFTLIAKTISLADQAELPQKDKAGEDKKDLPQKDQAKEDEQEQQKASFEHLKQLKIYSDIYTKSFYIIKQQQQEEEVTFYSLYNQNYDLIYNKSSLILLHTISLYSNYFQQLIISQEEYKYLAQVKGHIPKLCLSMEQFLHIYHILNQICTMLISNAEHHETLQYHAKQIKQHELNDLLSLLKRFIYLYVTNYQLAAIKKCQLI